MQRASSYPLGHAGFTLMEVLVAIVVFSIGLLGIATLQLTGMKQTHNSHLRAIAVAEARTLADRMRANPKAVENGDYNIGGVGAPHGSMPTSIPTDCTANDCTTAEMAVFDLVRWSDSTGGIANTGLDDALPEGRGVVCIDSTPDDGTDVDWECDYAGDMYAIKVQWRERGLDQDENDTEVRRFFMRVRP